MKIYRKCTRVNIEYPSVAERKGQRTRREMKQEDLHQVSEIYR